MYTNGTNILGLDCSRYQKSIDWAKAKADGIQFAYVKISAGIEHYEGNYYNLKARLEEIKKHGIKLGYYHFCSPGLTIIPSENAKEEVHNFVMHLTDLPESDLPLCLDIENYVMSCRWIPKKDINFTTYMQAFIKELPKEVLIYTNRWIWTDKDNFKIYPLWLPSYDNCDPRVMSINNPLPVGWDDWDIWQFTDKGKIDGTQGYVDLNWMKKEYFDRY
jgi:lysozyme